MFEAAVFAVIACGFVPRCAREIIDAGDIRIEKINRIIESCKFGIHDISRTELDPDHNLPRFNMPLELGLFLGCLRFGSINQKKKCCMIVDREEYRYHKFISDIAGQDISSHDNDPAKLIHRIRDWLRSRTKALPGGDHIVSRYREFRAALPDICRRSQLNEAKLTFPDLVVTIKEYGKDTLRDDPLVTALLS
jgi:hypothetical protein